MALPLRASRVVPIATARANLAKLVREARNAKGPVALITQRGKPGAYVVGAEWLDDIMDKTVPRKKPGHLWGMMKVKNPERLEKALEEVRSDLRRSLEKRLAKYS